MNIELKPEEPLAIISEEGDVLPRAFRYIIDHNTSNDAPYHHLNHMLRVMTYCNEGCKFHKITGKLRKDLLVAALFHDFGHSQGEKSDSENVKTAISAVREWYASNDLNHSSVNIERVANIIAATEYPYVIPKEDLTLEQAIIRDADLMIALDSDWMGNMIIGLATEMKVVNFKKMADGQHAFHSDIKMCSPFGQMVYDSQWSRIFENLNILRKVL